MAFETAIAPSAAFVLGFTKAPNGSRLLAWHKVKNDLLTKEEPEAGSYFLTDCGLKLHGNATNEKTGRTNCPDCGT